MGLLFAVGLYFFIDVIPPRAMTLTAMSETAARIGLYFGRNKRLPTDLGYANRSADGWGRPLIYTIDAFDAFTLRSLGRDGNVGGTGDDADVSLQYRIVDGRVQTIP
jgi:hypothetical protein